MPADSKHPTSPSGAARPETFEPAFAGIIDPGQLWRLLAPRLWVVFVAAGLALALAVTYLWRTPRVYAARAVLQVGPESRKVTGFDDPGADDFRPAEALKTIEQTLTNRSLLTRVARANDLARRPDFLGVPAGKPVPTLNESDLVDILGSRITVALRRGTRLIDVSVEDRNPEQARRLTESLLTEFAASELDDRSGVSKLAQGLLAKQAEELQAKLADSERELQSYRERTKAVSLEETQNIIAGQLRELNSKVTEAKGRRLELESAYAQVNAALASGVAPGKGGRNVSLSPGSDPSPAVVARLLQVPAISSTPEVVDLVNQLNQREADLAIIEKRYLYKHPKNVWAKNQIAQVRSALGRAATKAADVIGNSYRAAQETENSLGEALRQQEGAALELGRVSGPYNVLLRQNQSDRALYDAVLTRLKQTDVLNGVLPGMGQSGVRILEAPTTPTRPSKPRRLRTLLLALVVGTGAGVVVALGLAALDASLHTVDQTEDLLGLPALTSVPESRRRLRKGLPPTAAQLPLLHQPASAAAEAFRSLRTSLALLEGGSNHHSVLFTSAEPGEGKSFCSTNYAMALAQQGFSTLFINADLRRPQHADALLRRSAEVGENGAGEHPEIGLADCLAGHVPLSQAVRATDVTNLFLCPAGQRVPSPAELLARGRFAEIVREALQVFDRVVVDSPPVVTVSDCLLLAPHVGAVCLVIRAEKTPRRLVQRACRLLARAGVEPVGFILNRLVSGSAARRGEDAYYYREPATTAVEASPEAKADNHRSRPLSSSVRR